MAVLKGGGDEDGLVGGGGVVGGERQGHQMEWLTHKVGEEVNKLQAHLQGGNAN